MQEDTIQRTKDKKIIPQTEQQIKFWNWGPFCLTFLWCFFNGFRGWAILSLFPFIGFFIGVFFAISGNELAWDRDKYKHYESFIARQKKWNFAGKVAAAITVLSISFMLYNTYDINYGKSHSRIIQQLNNTNKLTTILDKPITNNGMIAYSTHSYVDTTGKHSYGKYSFIAKGPKAELPVTLIEYNNDLVYLEFTQNKKTICLVNKVKELNPVDQEAIVKMYQEETPEEKVLPQEES